MKRTRRTHKSESKTKVALAARQGDLTMAELVKTFDVHLNQSPDRQTPNQVPYNRAARIAA